MGVINLSNIIDDAFDSENKGFPLDVFPKPIKEFTLNANDTVGFNTDYLSAGILSTCATAIGNSVSLFNGSYLSKPILWLSIIGRSGIGKTHPLEFAKKPIENQDKQNYIDYQNLMQDYEMQEKDQKGRKPKYHKFILKDFTPEKLADTLQFNDKGALIFRDELIGWVNSFDQYKKGGDQQLYLELFNGGILTVDRITKEPVRVEKTNVNIIGGMQPKLLKAMSGNNRNDDGFLSRFLFVYPDNMKPKLFTGNSIDEIHSENYKRLVLNLLDVPTDTIQANSSNIEMYKDWQHAKSKACFNDDLETLIQAKLETYVWRLALIIELMQQATTGNYKNTLQDESLRKAIKLAEYFRINALRVNDRILSINPLEDLSTNKLILYKALPIEFKRADVLPLFDEHQVKGGSINRFLSKELFSTPKYGYYKKKFH